MSDYEALPRADRARLLAEQQGQRCCYCGVRFQDEMPADLRLYFDPRPSVEHLIRIADGGKRVWQNEVAACRGCNSARGDMAPGKFYELVSRGDLDALRRTLRTSISVKRRSRATLRKIGPAYQNVLHKGPWPPVIGELPMTPKRRQYFSLVYGPWPKTTGTPGKRRRRAA